MIKVDIMFQRLLPSEHQSAEWKIRAFKALSELLRLLMSRVSETRQNFRLVCAPLMTLRSRYVGLNQMRKVYSHRDLL